MKICIFSDLHGNQYAFRAFLKTAETLSPDLLIFCGDVFGYYYGQAEIMDGLCGLKNLVWLRGNHDQYFLDMLDGKISIPYLCERYGSCYERNLADISPAHIERLRSLPASWNGQFENYHLSAVHGTLANPLEGRLYPRDKPVFPPASFTAKQSIVIAGHTHFCMAASDGDTHLWLNPGSLGQPRNGLSSTCLLLILPDRKVEFIEISYDKASLITEARQKDPQNKKLVELLLRKREDVY